MAVRSNPRRLTLRRVLLGGFCAIIVTVGLIAFIAIRTPTWYQPPVIDPTQQQQLRNHLVQAEQAFTESLLAGQPFVYHIHQDDLNNWFAMRKEIYPRVDELTESALRDPFAIIEPDSITLAGKLIGQGIDGIVSVDVQPSFRNKKIVLTATAVRYGSLRLPMSVDQLGLNRLIELEEGEAWPGSPRIAGSLLSGLEIESAAWWRNGGIDYRVTDVLAHDGRLDIFVEPLGRHSERERSSQWSGFDESLD
ncbi:MAG TPA: hypothetical protein VNT79_19370 [Phycisphaerae bacterium]|nr:hypothetical protein [Phycisphaerae bacterium]